MLKKGKRLLGYFVRKALQITSELGAPDADRRGEKRMCKKGSDGPGSVLKMGSPCKERENPRPRVVVRSTRSDFQTGEESKLARKISKISVDVEGCARTKIASTCSEKKKLKIAIGKRIDKVQCPLQRLGEWEKKQPRDNLPPGKEKSLNWKSAMAFSSESACVGGHKPGGKGKNPKRTIGAAFIPSGG